MSREEGWIQTYTCRKVFPLKPCADDIHLPDIVHSLSMQCRFNGHTSAYFSVAEHCCHVHDILPDRFRLEALMHDASEAYLTDLPRPLKEMPEFAAVYRAAEDNLMCLIAELFGFPYPMSPEVKWADDALLAIEAHQLMAPLHNDWPIQRGVVVPDLVLPCWTPERAKQEFERRLRELL